MLKKNQIIIDTTADMSGFSAPLPEGGRVIGSITAGEKAGALVQISKSRYVMVLADGAVIALDGRSVTATLGLAGRPKKLFHPRPISVRLDPDDWATAERLGSGNVNGGIREALRLFRCGE